MESCINISKLEKEIFPGSSKLLEHYFKNDLLFSITIPKEKVLSVNESSVIATIYISILEEYPMKTCEICFRKINQTGIKAGVNFRGQSTNQEYVVTLYYINSENKIDFSETIHVLSNACNKIHSFVNSYQVLQANETLPVANQRPMAMTPFSPIFGQRESNINISATPVTYSSLPNKFINDNLHILCKIEIKTIPEKQNDGKTKTFQKFLSMYKEKVFTDFKIISNEQEFSVHKAVLAHSSPVFKKLLETPLKESQTSQVEINSFEPNIIELMIHFMYSDELEIEKELPQETLKELFMAAHVYQLENLQKLCLKKICKFAKDLSGVIDVILLAGVENKEEMINFLKDIRFTIMLNE